MSHDIAQWLKCQATLKREAKDYFLGLKRTKWEAGHKRGRINTSSLHRVVNGHVDVFKQRTHARLVNSAVSILVDSSGSMCGKTYEQACAAGILLAEVLDNVGVKVEVAGFTDWGLHKLVHEVHTAFGQRVNRDDLLARMYELGRCLSGNSDGENVMIAYDRILRQDVDKRIIIVLSDGEPSGCSGLDDHKMLRHAVSLITNESKFTNTQIWGVGIAGSHAVERFYKNYIIIEDDLDMTKGLLTLIKQAVVVK